MNAQHGERRWMGVGQSGDADSRVAAAAAAREAMVGDQPKLLIVFGAVSHDAARLLDGIRDVAADVPAIGCSSQGEISPSGPRDDTVIVAAIGGPGFSVSTAVSESVSMRQRAAGGALAQCTAEVDDLPHRVLVLLTDGLIRDQESIVRGCYGVLGASIPLVGGAAAEGLQQHGTYLLGNGRVLADGAVAATIASEAPLSVSVRHGWRPVGQPMIATSSGHGWVYTLDDRPALDTYLDRLGAPPAAYTDYDAFIEFALPRPIGVQRRSGIAPRSVCSWVDLEGRAISSGSAIDHGGLVWAMTGDEESILSATDTACEDALIGLGDVEPVGLLAFSCSALRAVLGDEGIRREGDRLNKWTEGRPYAGFYTYGEIARVRGIEGFHNQTLATLALG